MHRHLVVPLDADLHAGASIWTASRSWNCDWLALTRQDRAGGAGKLLEVAARLELPISFLTNGAWSERSVEIATPDLVLAWLQRDVPAQPEGGCGAVAEA
jgi:flagellar biosynthesis GTPase FlhF